MPEATPTQSEQGAGHTAGPEWQWWASRDEEDYLVGPCSTREIAIAEAEDYFDGEEAFHIVEAIQGSGRALIQAGREMIERDLQDAADDGAFGDDGDYDLRGKPDEVAAAYAEINASVEAWLTKWERLLPKPWRFNKTRNGEWIARAQGGAA